MKRGLCIALVLSLIFTPQLFQFSAYGQNESAPESDSFVPGEAIIKLKNHQINLCSGSKPDFLDDNLDCYIARSWNFSENSLNTSASADVQTEDSLASETTDMLLLKSKSLDTEQLIAELELQPNVSYAQPNYTYQICEQPNDPEFSKQWALSNPGDSGKKSGFDININSIWSEGVTGSEDYVVAILDTGVDYNHEDLKDNMWTDSDGSHGYNFIDSSKDPMDDNFHGTHCAGIIGAKANNNTGISGINQKVKMMALKIADSGGSISDSDAISAYKYMINKKASSVNIVSANNSWSSDHYSRALLEAINIAGEKGILSVCASGNEQTNNNLSNSTPANFDSPYIISVGATSPNGTRWMGSNFGDITVDVMAPGDKIYSTIPNNCYDYKTGTSMATPIISGAVALLNDYSNSKTKNWSPQEIRHRIIGGTNTSISSLKSFSVSGGYFDFNEVIFNPQPVLENFTLSDNILTLNGVFFGNTPGSVSIDSLSSNFTISSWQDNKIVINLHSELTGKHKFNITNSTTNKSGQCSFNLNGDFENLNSIVIDSDTQNGQYKTLRQFSIIGKNNGIYAFGGEVFSCNLKDNYNDTDPSYDIYRYDILTKTWAKQEISLPDKNLIYSTTNISLVADENYIWMLMSVYEDESHSNVLKVLYKYDPKTNTFVDTENRIIVDDNVHSSLKSPMTYINDNIYILNLTSSLVSYVKLKTKQIQPLDDSLPCMFDEQAQIQAISNKIVLVGRDISNSKCQYYRTFVLDCSDPNPSWVEKSHTKNIKTKNQQEQSFTSGLINSDQILFTGMFTVDSADRGSWIYNISTDTWQNANATLSLQKVSNLSGCSYNNYFYALGISNNSENLFKRLPLNDDTVSIKYTVNNERFGSISTTQENIALSTGEALGSIANPNPGYQLKSWKLNGEIVSTEDSFIPSRENGVYNAHTYEAYFEDCWEKDENGNWRYLNKDGSFAKGWLKDPADNNWYYLDLKEGHMLTGWFKDPDDNNWYYLDLKEGNILTGWFKDPDDKSWYYFSEDVSNNEQNLGKMQTGWVKHPSDDKWYYFDTSNGNNEGKMLTGWFTDPEDKAQYYFSEDFNNNEENLGKMQTGWILYKNDWYYLSEDVSDNEQNLGKMQVGWVFDKEDNAWHYMDTVKGTMITGWLIDPDDGCKYYFNEDGMMVTGNQTINNISYLFDSEGILQK